MVSESGTVAASYNASLSFPAAFPFEIPDMWPKWHHRFEQYRLASSLSNAELLMGRKLKTDVPVPKSVLTPHGFFQGERQRVQESSKTDL